MKEFFYHYQHCASYSGTLNCSGLLLPAGRGTETCDSGTVPVIQGQLVTLMATNFDPLEAADCWKLEFWKSKMAAAAVLINRKKSRYLGRVSNSNLAAFCFTVLELVLCDTVHL